jgi:hypothetical protein
MTVNLHRVLVIIVVICIVVIFLIIFAVQSSSSPAHALQRSVNIGTTVSSDSSSLNLASRCAALDGSGTA